MGNRATSKVTMFSNIYQNINQKQLNKLVICYMLRMLFFPSDRKETNQILVGKKTMKILSTALRFLTPKKLKYAIFFNEDGKGT